MSQPNVTLFVYGTLRRNSSHVHLLGNAIWHGECVTKPNMTLLDLGDYPGLVLDGKTAVIGDLVTIAREQLSLVDEYEGYPKDYNRSQIQLANGRSATTYIYIGPKESSIVVADGNWEKYFYNRYLRTKTGK
ncbi:MAG: gamma-glutamylcyclotransferase family protein [Myxococcota bacterium]|nr:gamma-glutamylcyclotransferase family protein [Myxococcota bacterium]